MAIRKVPHGGTQPSVCAQVMLTMREVAPEGPEKKNTRWKARAIMHGAGARAQVASRHLEQAVHEERNDHLSLTVKRRETLSRGVTSPVSRDCMKRAIIDSTLEETTDWKRDQWVASSAMSRLRRAPVEPGRVVTGVHGQPACARDSHRAAGGTDGAMPLFALSVSELRLLLAVQREYDQGSQIAEPQGRPPGQGAFPTQFAAHLSRRLPLPVALDDRRET